MFKNLKAKGKRNGYVLIVYYGIILYNLPHLSFITPYVVGIIPFAVGGDQGSERLSRLNNLLQVVHLSN